MDETGYKRCYHPSGEPGRREILDGEQVLATIERLFDSTRSGQ